MPCESASTPPRPRRSIWSSSRGLADTGLGGEGFHGQRADVPYHDDLRSGIEQLLAALSLRKPDPMRHGAHSDRGEHSRGR